MTGKQLVTCRYYSLGGAGLFLVSELNKPMPAVSLHQHF